MELVNRTPLSARLDVTEIQGLNHRVGIIVAKATYTFDEDGIVVLDTQNPFPIFLEDVDTDLGLLPRDDFPRIDEAFEVIFLGAAYAPAGKPVQKRKVALQVGKERRELMVFGDRVWNVCGELPFISTPESFVRMPLTYQNAFGGTYEITIDKESVVEISDPNNRLGKGMNPTPLVETLKEMFTPPDGYPKFDSTRCLPNIENPKELISDWNDEPLPVYWATVPPDSAIQMSRSMVQPEEREFTGDITITLQEGVYHRAHPDWIISLPHQGAMVRLEGLTPEGDVSFKLPSLRVFADYVIGEKRGEWELVPQVLVILGDEKKLYLVFKRVFQVAIGKEIERSIRIRTETGWYKSMGGNTE